MTVRRAPMADRGGARNGAHHGERQDGGYPRMIGCRQVGMPSRPPLPEANAATRAAGTIPLAANRRRTT